MFFKRQPSKEQIEAAALALYGSEMARCRNANQVISKACGREITEGNDEPFEKHADTTWRPDARRALLAAMAVPNPLHWRFIFGYRGHESRLIARGPNWLQFTFPPTRKVPRISLHLWRPTA